MMKVMPLLGSITSGIRGWGVGDLDSVTNLG